MGTVPTQAVEEPLCSAGKDLKLLGDSTAQGPDDVGQQSPGSAGYTERIAACCQPGPGEWAGSKGSPKLPTPRVHPGIIPSLEDGQARE